MLWLSYFTNSLRPHLTVTLQNIYSLQIDATRPRKWTCRLVSQTATLGCRRHRRQNCRQAASHGPSSVSKQREHTQGIIP